MRKAAEVLQRPQPTGFDGEERSIRQPLLFSCIRGAIPQGHVDLAEQFGSFARVAR